MKITYGENSFDYDNKLELKLNLTVFGKVLKEIGDELFYNKDINLKKDYVFKNFIGEKETLKPQFIYDFLSLLQKKSYEDVKNDWYKQMDPLKPYLYYEPVIDGRKKKRKSKRKSKKSKRKSRKNNKSKKSK